MTDKELKTLFDSIKDFDDFTAKVTNREDIILKNDLSIVFQDNLQPARIDITLASQKFSFDDLSFSNIIKDILTEKRILEKEKILREGRVNENRLKNEIIYLNDNTYKVNDEYIEEMLLAGDVASGQGFYHKKLEDLLRLLNNKNVILINEQKINSRKELVHYLKTVGFYFIDEDIS